MLQFMLPQISGIRKSPNQEIVDNLRRDQRVFFHVLFS